MGGGKGQGSFNQTSQFTPPPWALAGGQQAVQTAQQLQQTPFEIPTQPIAGFSPQQQEAFQEVENAQGMAQPYFNAGTGLVAQGAFPNINQYFGAESSGVVPELQNIFGQQTAQQEGQLTQQAGGIGADRIGVGLANLANQQGLSAGQTLSQIMGQSVGQAQQGAQLEQQAGTSIANMGPQAQGAALQGATAELQTGTLAQQQEQNQANAAYENILQGISWPFQTNQYLGSMAAGVTPAMGGTGVTSGNVKSSMMNTSGGKGLASGLGGAMAKGSGGAIPYMEDGELKYAEGGAVASNPFDMPTPMQGGGAYNYGPGQGQPYNGPADYLGFSSQEFPAVTPGGQYPASTGERWPGEQWGWAQPAGETGILSGGPAANAPAQTQAIAPQSPAASMAGGNNAWNFTGQGSSTGSGSAPSFSNPLMGLFGGSGSSGKGQFSEGGGVGRTHLKGGGSPPPPTMNESPAAGSIVSVPFAPAEGGPQPLTLSDPGGQQPGDMPGLNNSAVPPPPNIHAPDPISMPSYQSLTPGLQMNKVAGVGSGTEANPFTGLLSHLMDERADLLGKLGSPTPLSGMGGGLPGAGGFPAAIGKIAGATAGAAGAGAAKGKQEGGSVGADDNPFAVPSSTPTLGVSNLLGGSQSGVPSIGAKGVIPVAPVQGHPSPQMQELMKYKGPSPQSLTQGAGGGGGGGGGSKSGNSGLKNLMSKLSGQGEFSTQDKPPTPSSDTTPSSSLTETGDPGAIAVPGTGKDAAPEAVDTSGAGMMMDAGPSMFADAGDMGGAGKGMMAARGGPVHMDVGGDPADLNYGLANTSSASPFTPQGEIAGTQLPFSIESQFYQDKPQQMAGLDMGRYGTVGTDTNRPQTEGSGKADFTGEPLGMPNVNPPDVRGQTFRDPMSGAPMQGAAEGPQQPPGRFPSQFYNPAVKSIGDWWNRNSTPQTIPQPGPQPGPEEAKSIQDLKDKAAEPITPPGPPSAPPGGPAAPPPPGVKPPGPPAAPAAAPVAPHPVQSESTGAATLREQLGMPLNQLIKQRTGQDLDWRAPDPNMPTGQWAVQHKDLFDKYFRPMLNERGFSNEDIDTALGQKHPLPTIKGSMFGDETRKTVSGLMPSSTPGIALPHPIQKGMRYEVTDTKTGKSFVVPQIDVGPSQVPGKAGAGDRGVDISENLAHQFGYHDKTDFPTDKSQFTVRPIKPDDGLATSEKVPPNLLQQAQTVARTQGPGGVQKFMASQGWHMSRNWCGEFAASVVASQGYNPPHGAPVASNWRTWGEPTNTPQPGDIAVRRGGREGPVATGDTGSHVTFIKEVRPDGTFVGVGGNQGGKAGEKTFQTSAYEFRHPTSKDLAPEGQKPREPVNVQQTPAAAPARPGAAPTGPATGYGPPPGYNPPNALSRFFQGWGTNDPAAAYKTEMAKFGSYEAAANWDAANNVQYGSMSPEQGGAHLADHLENTKSILGEGEGQKQGQPGTIAHANATGQTGPGGGANTPVGGGTPPTAAGAPASTNATAPAPTIPPPSPNQSSDPATAAADRMLATRNPAMMAKGMDMLVKAAQAGNLNAETRLHNIQAAAVGWQGRGNMLINPLTNEAFIPGRGRVPMDQLMAPAAAAARTPGPGVAPAEPTAAPAAPGAPPAGGGAMPAPATPGAPAQPLPTGAEPQPQPQPPQTGDQAALATQPVYADHAFARQEARPAQWPVDMAASPQVVAKAREAAQTEAAAGQQTEQILETMETLYGKTGAFTKPGFMFNHRVEFMNAMNTALRLVGQPGIAENELGSAIGLNKLQTQLATASVKGLGREPGYILNMLKSSMVPNGEMPPAAFYGIVAEMHALNQRAIDHATELQQYTGTYGTELGFEEAFARANPPQKYAAMADLAGAVGPKGQRMTGATLDAVRRNPANVAPFSQAWKVNPNAFHWVTAH